jgi:hypothetical protein
MDGCKGEIVREGLSPLLLGFSKPDRAGGRKLWTASGRGRPVTLQVALGEDYTDQVRGSSWFVLWYPLRRFLI